MLTCFLISPTSRMLSISLNCTKFYVPTSVLIPFPLTHLGYVTCLPAPLFGRGFGICQIGWTHALHLCQDMHRKVLEWTIPDIFFLEDNSPPPSLGYHACSLYVDNAIFFGTDQATVN